ncbi:DUF1622 domain-containing protein [Candidatus Bathyarchaeota archaeon]|nr:DUF1622 domain-containing protein [Candidatus Bathyarchaeota archaeon]
MENQAVEKPRGSNLSLFIIVAIALFAVAGAVVSLLYPDFIFLISGPTYVTGGALFDAIYVILTLATYALYLIGGAVLVYGAVLVTYRFIQYKVSDPYKPTHSTHFLSNYLTLSLNFFIGAEIIRTVAVRTYEEFALLILVIFSRGLFSLILYLERKWHGLSEEE